MSKPYFAYRSFRKEFDAMRRFAAAGIDQFCVFAAHSDNSLGEPYCEYAPVWKWYDSYDFAPFDQQMNDLLAIAPEAKVLCMIDLNSPLWMARQTYVDSYSHLSCAISEKRWRDETAKFVGVMVDYAEKHYGDRILCYILMCGKTDEWMDHSEGAETQSKLQLYQQWSERNGFPVPAEAPSVSRRECFPRCGGTLRDPAENADAIRYWKFHGDLIAETIIHFGGVVKSHLKTVKDVGVFYGYILELARNRLVRCGHLAYEKVDASEVIDFVISPGRYSDRPMGGASGFMTPNGTIHRCGKSCLYEIDHRTHSAMMQLTPYVSLGWMDKWENLSEDRAGIIREFCRTLIFGASLWWFDMWGKFYDAPETVELIGQCRKLWLKYGDSSAAPAAEVALVVDPDSALLFNDRSEIAGIYSAVQIALNRIGAPYQTYTLNDLPFLPEEIKLVVFSGVVEITPEKRAMIEKYVTCSRYTVWHGPCGLTDGTTWRESELAGERIADWQKVDWSMIRAAAEKAGVHIYTDEPAVIFAGVNLLSYHSAVGGIKNIRLKNKVGRVTELFSNRLVAENCDCFEVNFAEPDTQLFKLES